MYSDIRFLLELNALNICHSSKCLQLGKSFENIPVICYTYSTNRGGVAQLVRAVES
mgnify:CR=1 FL=1